MNAPPQELLNEEPQADLQWFECLHVPLPATPPASRSSNPCRLSVRGWVDRSAHPPGTDLKRRADCARPCDLIVRAPLRGEGIAGQTDADQTKCEHDVQHAAIGLGQKEPAHHESPETDLEGLRQWKDAERWIADRRL